MKLARSCAAPEFAHARVDAVGGDHGVGLRRRAVGEAQLTPSAAPVDVDELLVERDQFGGHARGQRLVQVAAMHEQIRRAVFRLGVGAERKLVFHRAGVPFAVGPGARLERAGADALFQADAAQHPHRVGAHLDAGAEPHEFRRLLIDAHR